jgi:hypothetical protein
MAPAKTLKSTMIAVIPPIGGTMAVGAVVAVAVGVGVGVVAVAVGVGVGVGVGADSVMRSWIV